jgi:hypothetical protein
MLKSLVGAVGLALLVACGSEAPAPREASSDPSGAEGTSPAGATLGAPVLEALGEDGAVRLSWEPVAGATGYDVSRRTGIGSAIVVASTKEPSFTDADVVPEQAYLYTVTARSDAGVSPPSSEVAATPFSFDMLHMRHNAQVLRAVAGGNGVLVAVGDGTRILRSADGGATWSDVRAPGYGGLNAITFGAGRFVAVGDSGLILGSTDGLVWELESSGVTAVLNGIAFGGGRFVAIGGGATVLTSTDGLSWSGVANNLHHTQNVAFDYRLQSIAYGDDTLDYFVVTATDASGNGGYAFYVTGDADLATWAPAPSGYAGSLASGPINAVTFGKYEGPTGMSSSFHLVGWGGFWGHAEQTTPGLLSFATVSAGTASDTWRAVAFDGTETLKAFSTSGKVMTCSVSGACKNGLNGWTEETVASNGGLWGGTFTDGRFVAVGSDELVVGRTTAPDASFVDLHRSSPSFTHLLTKRIAGVGDAVIAAGTFGGRYLHSPDGGVTFASVTSPTAAALWDAKALGGKLFMVGSGSTIMSSATGAEGSWTVMTPAPTTETLRAIAGNGSLYLAAGDKGAVFTSPDGITWAHQASSGFPIVNLEWEGTTFVGTTADGHVLTTNNGQTWTDVLFDDASQMALDGLAIDGGTIVVTGREGHVWRSIDHGASFTPHHIAEAPALVGVARFAGKWIAAGSKERSELWTSSDAITWTRRTATPSVAYSVSVAAGKLFVAGSRGAIYSTRPETKPSSRSNKAPTGG